MPTDSANPSSPDRDSEEESGDGDDIYYVERILDRKREADGTVRYLIKWQGYDASENTWEPRENLPADLIEEFKKQRDEEKKEKKTKKKSGSRGSSTKTAPPKPVPKLSLKSLPKPSTITSPMPSTSSGSGSFGGSSDGSASPVPEKVPVESVSGVKGKKRSYEVNAKSGFERGLKARKIHGACIDNGRINFLIEWGEDGDADLVLAEEAHKHIPLKVIKFYEDRIMWSKPAEEA